MGRVYLKERKKGPTWYIEYYCEGKQFREAIGSKKAGITERMAREALNSRLGDIVKGKFDLAKPKMAPPFNDLFKDYIDTYSAHKLSYKRDLTSAKHLSVFFKNKRLDAISPWAIEKYKSNRKEQLRLKHPAKADLDINFASINRELALLKHFCSKLVREGKIDRNPVTGIRMCKEISRERYLSSEEITRLIAACEQSENQCLKPIVITALNSGMRIQELLTLRVIDLNFKNRIINIEHTKNGTRGKIPMNNVLCHVLKALLTGRSCKSGFVFCHPDNGRRFKDIRKAFKKALNAAQIEGFRFHDLRHTFASHLALNGVDLLAIQKLGRWKTLSMVTKYAHLTTAHKLNAINSLGSLFENKDYLRSKPENEKISKVVKIA